MSEDKISVPLSEIRDELNPFKDFQTVLRKEFNNVSIEITTDGLDIPKNEAARLIENTHKAVLIANKINDGPIEGYEKDIKLKFPQKGQPTLMSDLNANEALLRHDNKSQTAAVLHEIIHGIEEQAGGFKFSSETMPLMTEFLFSGETRKDFFQELTKEVIGGVDNAHASGWEESISLLSAKTNQEIDLEKETAESIIQKLTELKKLGEEEKIKILKTLIS